MIRSESRKGCQEIVCGVPSRSIHLDCPNVLANNHQTPKFDPAPTVAHCSSMIWTSKVERYERKGRAGVKLMSRNVSHQLLTQLVLHDATFGASLADLLC